MTQSVRTKQKSETDVIKAALAGNPNCGKTTLFNRLTGSSQYVGNWPGVTVEKKQGMAQLADGTKLSVLDLPGIYSLSPYSPEEMITRNALIDVAPDVIINIVDVTNPERNLYLTTQLVELGIPMVVALNMTDVQKKRGEMTDTLLMSSMLGLPVVPISANTGDGMDSLMSAVSAAARQKSAVSPVNIYSPSVNKAISDTEQYLTEHGLCVGRLRRWTAVKLLEGDAAALKELSLTAQQLSRIERLASGLRLSGNTDREMLIADERYRYICAVTKRTITHTAGKASCTVSDRIDLIATGRWTALPMFFLMMLAVFYITFGPLGSLLQDIVGQGTELLRSAAEGLTNVGASEWAARLVADGIIGGVGSVVSFLPQIMLLFFLLSLLEDSGYMARAAFIMDRLLRSLGLSGKAFVPMLMGFGCTVPAVLATRTLSTDKDKRLTIMLIPFMSCSAKMSVYLYVIPAFFGGAAPFVIFGLYILGMLTGVFTALLFKNTIFRGDNSPFVMELPPYRLPSKRSLWLHVWERLKDFLVRAGTVLVSAAVIVWFLGSFDTRLCNIGTDRSSESILAAVGTAIAPVFSLCGFGDWRASVSLVTGLAAKESVVASMTVLYGVQGAAGAFSVLSAMAFSVFVLLYTPCIAAVSAIYREMNSLRHTALCVVYQMFIAWLASALVFQTGSLLQRLAG